MLKTALPVSPSTGGSRLRRRALLQSVSVGALLLASSHSKAAPFRSLNQALALSSRVSTGAMAPAAGVTAARSAQAGAQNLAAAAARFASLSQSLSRISGSATLPSVPDGVGAGGLEIITANGANTPQQQTGTYNVTIKQTQALAQLSWKTFNVGAHTKLTFDQSVGATPEPGWVVINTIQDPAQKPSQILGSISAPGKVYVLNRNGVAFGAGSTINVGALVAATAVIAQAQFGTDAAGQASLNVYGAQSGTSFAPTFIDGGTGSITVAAGASIATPAPVSGSGARGGSVMLLGANVNNAGVIATPQGQTVLAAGTQFTLRQGSNGTTTTGNTTSTTLGSEVAALNTPVPGKTVSNAPNAAPLFTTGAVSNEGIVVADQGDISLVGQNVTQSGVLLSTTTVNTRGTIHLLTPTSPTDPGSAYSSISLAPGSVTEILPEDDGSTALDSQRAANIAASAALNAQRVAGGVPSSANPQLADHSVLPDQAGESRIELSGGGTVDLQPGALAVTPGGQVAIGAASRVLVENGATIDVSGSTDAVLPASVNDLVVNVQPYQLRDTAANRTGGLKSNNVNVDARTLVEIASGAYGPTAANPLGNIYTPGGLLEVGGYLGLVPHGIDEWTAIGGQVTLQSQPAPGSLALGGDVITQAGSVINLTGGTVTYAAGPIAQTYVQTTSGQIYNINNAPGNLVYAGIYKGVLFSEPRWRVTDTYVNPLLTPATTLDPGYVVGRDAGSLTISASSAVLQGTVDAGVTYGQNQNAARPATVSDPYLLAQNVVPKAGALLIGDYATGQILGGITGSVVFADTQGLAAPATVSTALPASLFNTVQIDAPLLAKSGIATLDVTTLRSIVVDSPIAVADGGSIALNASAIEIDAGVTARGGSIALSNLSPFDGRPLVAPTKAAPGSITLSNNAVLDARGVWTNGKLSGKDTAGETLVNGGSVTIQGVGSVTLRQGTGIDVSSGGAILRNGKALTGTGGNIAITADIDPTTATSPIGSGAVTLDASFNGIGSGGGGTLSLSAPEIVIGDLPDSLRPNNAVVLAPALFQTGFSHYVVDGTEALTVAPRTTISPAEPIYVAAEGLAVPTGGDPSTAYTVVLPDLFTPVRSTDALTQRQGASIALLSDTDPGALSGLGGAVTIGAGAVVSVDPGQSIVVAGRGQVTLAGTLSAPSGTVEVAVTRTDAYLPPDMGQGTSQYLAGLSVWLASTSRIDVSGQSTLFADAAGRTFGTVSPGGTIELGGYGGLANADSTLAQVIERPGAVLEADGASATIGVIANDIGGGLTPQAAPITLASAGGTLVARSIAGIALDGQNSAHSGGARAAGGALYLSIDPIDLSAYNNIPLGIYQPSQIIVSQAAIAGQPANLQAGQITPNSTFGLGRISQAQIASGGFDQVNLSGADYVGFLGNVSLSAARSITLTGSVIGAETANTTVSIAAPHVVLAGFAGFPGISSSNATINSAPTAATLSVKADLLDLQDALYLGGVVSLGAPANPDGSFLPVVNTSALGFAQTDLTSAGDIRFLGETGTQAAILASQGNITIKAAQLYPVSGQATAVYAGVDFAGATAETPNPLSGGTITILGNGTDPAAPYSVGGSLALVADTIEQDGIVRAPQGSLRFGWGGGDGTTLGYGGNDALTSAVTFGKGGITSVSLIGQTIPYGGTVDGVNYLLPANTGAAVGIIQASLEVDSQSVDLASGATLDLRGGGTLAGAGFIAGRGGSVDVLRSPLLNLSGGAAVALGLAQTAAVQPKGASDPVYAILPGYQSGYAPATGAAETGLSTPALGEQITVGNTVPGLAAGTYTLLPATYALLPGAFRVELTPGTLLAGSQVALGNFSSAAPVITSIANTGVSTQVPQAAIFTSGTNVRQLSQYDEETYNEFETATGTQFGAPRPYLPQDAKTLVLNYPALAGTLTALSVAANTVLKAPDPVLPGYGLTVEVESSAPIDVLGHGDTANEGDVALDATVLSSLDAPRLLIGGTIFVPPTIPDIAQITGIAPGVTLMSHAVLTAGDVMLTTSGTGSITVSRGATITTIGAGAAATDLSNGFYFSAGTAITYPVLDVSNGQDVFLPTSAPVAGASISIGGGAALLAGGSLNIVAPSGTSVGIGVGAGQVTLGGKYVSLAVGDINIGTPADKTLALPTGLNLSADTLATLLNGNAALGVPAASQLTLTATDAVNIIGAVTLDTQDTALVLNTPAIYGYGTAADTARIDTTASFTWNGVETQTASTEIPLASALPGGQIAGSDTHVTGNLVISAADIVLGYGPQTQPNTQLQLDRLLTGFANVSLNASKEITANNQSSLSVFATQTVFGEPGTGGNLTLTAPLVTTDSAAVLKITAGGMLSVSPPPPPGTPSATGSIATLGGEIDLTAGSIDLDTAIALPAGRLTVTAQNAITFGSATNIDLAGRATTLFDQTALSHGGTLIAESTTGSITADAGAVIDVAAPAAKGGISGAATFSALAGAVALNATFEGAAAAPGNSGTISIIAGTLPDFDALNAGLDTGGFFGARDFEIAAGDIAIDTTLKAHEISVAADSGSIDITGTVDASGTTPGDISLQAGKNLTLAAGAVLDAHATQTAVDSYGQPIDAENRAHVALTAAAGTLTLNGGTIDASYPGENQTDTLHPDGNPQGQVSLYAPRVDGAGQLDTNPAGTGKTVDHGFGDVALDVTATPVITGAASIALYPVAHYVPTDPLGTIGQGSGKFTLATATVTLAEIDADNTAFIANFATQGARRLGGLASYGGLFHVRPGVEIDSSAASGGNLTISEDLDFSGLRYASGAGYGTPKTNVEGSGEPGSIVFRATNQLTVNGSVSDGFAAPPSSAGYAKISGSDGWVFLSSAFSPAVDPLAADVILPSSLYIRTVSHGVVSITHRIELGGINSGFGIGTTFDVARAISLNYDINIAAAYINPNRVIPFSVSLGDVSAPIPPGGWVATAAITDAAHKVLFAKGTVIPAGTVLAAGDILTPGSALPVEIQSADSTTVPAGTLLNLFAGDVASGSPLITLYNATAPLPVNALLPANTAPVFTTIYGKTISRLDLRPVKSDHGNNVQGLIYPLAALLPAGSLSWDLSFVAGANANAASTDAVQPKTVLAGGALATPANTPNQAAGSLILGDQHDFKASASQFSVAPAFSVIRTGTGDLDLAAGGNFDQSSLFGIYTAGSQTSLGSAAADAPYELDRNHDQGHSLDILPGKSDEVKALNHILRDTYAAYYSNGGGDLSLLAQGSITGDQVNIGSSAPPSDGVGNWLLRQGGDGVGQLGAWFINYGTVVSSAGAFGTPSLQLVGFEGIGTLGGGNVSIVAGGDAGQTTGRGDSTPLSSEGLVVAVGGSGRVLASGGIVLTGGGTETVQIGGALNKLDLTGEQGDATNGDFVDLRGAITVSAGSIGSIATEYGSGTAAYDPRALDPFLPDYNGAPVTEAVGGPNVVPGDSSVQIDTLRDLVLGGAGDPGRVQEQVTIYSGRPGLGNLTKLTSTGVETGFSLWTPSTSISLFSAGDDVTPTTQPLSGLTGGAYDVNDAATDYRFIYPANLFVTAATGNIVYGSMPTDESAPTDNNLFGLETAPAAGAEIAFLAGGSIFANGFAIDMSGASPQGLTSPFNPAYTLTKSGNKGHRVKVATVTNIRTGQGTNQSPLALFALEADTPTTDLHEADTVPEMFYAAGGDIVNLVAGQTITFASGSNESQPAWYLAAKPVRILASQDIVSSGTRPGLAEQGVQQNQQGLPQFGPIDTPTVSGDLFLNNRIDSVSEVSAGRDIISGYFYVGGPGVLEVDAGRNLFQGAYTVAATQVLDFGAIRSLGPLLAGTQPGTTGGADIDVLAGIGAGADYSAFAALYFNPANQANLALPITDPSNAGKVQETYNVAGGSDTVPGSMIPILSTTLPIDTFPVAYRDLLVREAFFDEILASGRQETDPTSRFFGSYARGRLAIDTLFPSTTGTTTTPGVPSGYTGSITMLSGPVTVANGPLLTGSNGAALTFDAGISTQSGGTIQVLDPGGQILLGTAGGAAPGGGSGIIGNGLGNVDLFAKDSILLGRSRIFTTGGGNILAWSAEGDINAGIGARTTVVYTPPVITYDATGGLSETAIAPTNGAGIATLQPLPGIPPGDVDLIAPLGTIDAGEAGIRVAGNLNLAALALANTANTTVGGITHGITVAASVSLGAVEAAGAVAGAASSAAHTTIQQRPAQEVPSVIEVVVDVLDRGYDEKKRKRKG